MQWIMTSALKGREFEVLKFTNCALSDRCIQVRNSKPATRNPQPATRNPKSKHFRISEDVCNRSPGV